MKQIVQMFLLANTLAFADFFEEFKNDMGGQKKYKSLPVYLEKPKVSYPVIWPENMDHAVMKGETDNGRPFIAVRYKRFYLGNNQEMRALNKNGRPVEVEVFFQRYVNQEDNWAPANTHGYLFGRDGGLNPENRQKMGELIKNRSVQYTDHRGELWEARLID